IEWNAGPRKADCAHQLTYRSVTGVRDCDAAADPRRPELLAPQHRPYDVLKISVRELAGCVQRLDGLPDRPFPGRRRQARHNRVPDDEVGHPHANDSSERGSSSTVRGKISGEVKTSPALGDHAP